MASKRSRKRAKQRKHQRHQRLRAALPYVAFLGTGIIVLLLFLSSIELMDVLRAVGGFALLAVPIMGGVWLYLKVLAWQPGSHRTSRESRLATEDYEHEPYVEEDKPREYPELEEYVEKPKDWFHYS